MNEDELMKIAGSIEEKVGKENAAAIADDLGTLITKNSETLKAISEKDAKIAELKSTNEKLVSANGNLLKQIPMVEDDFSQRGAEPQEEEKKPFSWKACFDKQGNFIQ